MMKKRSESLSRGLFWSVVGSGSFMVGQILMIIGLSRLTSVENVGRYGVALSVATIVITFFNLNLRIGKTTDATAQHSTSIYVSTRIASTTIAFVVIVFSLALATSDKVTIYMGAVIAASKCAEAISDLYYSIFQRNGRMDLMARSMIVRGPISAVLFVSALYLTENVIFAFLCQLAVWWSVALFHDMLGASKIEPVTPQFKVSKMMKLVRETLPLGFAGLLTAVATNSPRLIVAYFLGLSSAGIFTSVAYVLQVGTVFAASVSRAIAHRLADQFAAGKFEAFGSLVRKTSLVMLALGLCFTLIVFGYGEALLTVAFGAEIGAYQTLFTLLTATLTLRLLIAVLQTAVLSQRRFTEFARHRMWVAIAMVTACSLGTLGTDLNGVGVALLTVSVYQVAALLIILRSVQSQLLD